MQTQRIHRLERSLTLIIALALIFAGLCIYVYLVEVYESHWARRVPPHLQGKSYVRWAPIEAEAVPGYPETFQPHAWFTLPADALETLLLLSQDRHASGVVHDAQSAGSTAYITEGEVEVQTFNESEEALLRPDARTMDALRRGRGQYGIGVFAAQEMRQGGARDDVTRNVIVWLPGLRSEADMANRVVPWLASGPQQPRHVVNKDPPFTQTTLSSTSALIELDTGILDEKKHIFAPNRYIRAELNISSPFDLATTRERIAVLANIINDGLPFSAITDAKEPEKISPASINEGVNARIFHANAPWQNSELVTEPSGPALGSAQDAGVVSPSAISDLYLYPGYEGSFKLLAVNIHPFVIEKHVVEDPAEQAQPRHVTSRIVGRGVSLIREDVE